MNMIRLSARNHVTSYHGPSKCGFQKFFRVETTATGAAAAALPAVASSATDSASPAVASFATDSASHASGAAVDVIEGRIFDPSSVYDIPNKTASEKTSKPAKYCTPFPEEFAECAGTSANLHPCFPPNTATSSVSGPEVVRVSNSAKV